jgi:hypothetical protein
MLAPGNYDVKYVPRNSTNKPALAALHLETYQETCQGPVTSLKTMRMMVRVMVIMVLILNQFCHR